MNANAELLRWRAQWQRQSEPIAVEALRESVMRDTRRLKIAMIAPVLVTLLIGGTSTLRAMRQATPEGWLLLAGVWFFIVVTWVVCLFLARGTWRPRADTAAAFVDIAVRRCESALASVPFAIALYFLELTSFLAWKFRYLPTPDVADLLVEWPTTTFGWIGFPVFVAFMLHYAKRKRRELANLLELRAQLHSD